jgi:proline-specific peptidase
MAERMISVPGGRVRSEMIGDGEKTPLLCLHGGPGFPSAYLDSLRALADERPIVFYDQLGCGHSDRPPAGDGYYVKERFVAEVARVREALGLREIHLLGQSWGGMLATLYALERPEGLRSVIFASPVIDVPRWLADCAQLKAELPAGVRETIDRHEAAGFTGCPEYTAASLEWWRRHICRIAPFPDEVERAFAGFGTECYETMWGPSEFTCTGNLAGLELSHRLAEITCPTLFTCGRYDEATPASTKRFADLVPHSEFRVFEHSSHMAHLEEVRNYIACVRAFIATCERERV